MELDLCNHYKVLPTEDRWKQLSWIQKVMLYKGMHKNKNENVKLISEIIDSLKPWLDKDMWFSIKEQEKNIRVNSNF